MQKYTPMIRQYLDIKKDYEDTLLFYRLGDFYELFFDDAKLASKELDLVLTARNAGVKDKIPMCGVPHHAADSYILRLSQKGYKIAIVEQLEDPQLAKGIVERGVVKIVTPGTIMDELSENSESIFLASIIDYHYGYALAFSEMASGKIIVFNVESDIEVLKEYILSYNTKEVVVVENINNKVIKMLNSIDNILVSTVSNVIELEDYQHLYENVDNQYQKDVSILMLNYLNETQKKSLNHLRKIEVINENDYLKMDYNSIINLELVDSLRASQNQMSLWKFLNHTKSSMGARKLKEFISRPLINKDLILKRQNMIVTIKDDYLLSDDLNTYLNDVYDLERLNAKFSYGNANPIDILRLKKTLSVVPDIFKALSKYDVFSELINIDTLESLHNLLESAISDEAKVSVRDGNIFKEGYNSDLDKARLIQKEGQNWILQLEAKERLKTGINNLKVGYNRVFGYYFEVSKANRDKIKEEDGYIRKQTLTNSERFVNEELKAKEEEILNADERSKDLEYELFIELTNHISLFSLDILKLSEVLAYIDVLNSLAYISKKHNYVIPKISDDRTFKIIKGRHPILDDLMKDNTYVANNLDLSNEDIWIITGPNMGGKSTFMRQVTLIVIMAQMGMLIPADEAIIPIFDQIFTRIGASDDILSGKSTFMVEMFEANHALKSASENSLIIFDEIGRGTSTYDGLALAKAMLEYIATNIKAKTLFSTHYHELVELADNFDNIKNYHVKVYEEDEEITFLYEVVSGIANRSYGINVAKLAGLPDNIINRAASILNNLEATKLNHNSDVVFKEVEVMPKEYKKIKDLLLNVDINSTSPMMALQFLDDLIKEVKKDKK